MCLPRRSGIHELFNIVFPEISMIKSTNSSLSDAMGERMILTTQKMNIVDPIELAIDQLPVEVRT